MGCTPDFGPEVGVAQSGTGTWPDLLTSAQLASLNGGVLGDADAVAKQSLSLSQRAAALRTRAQRLSQSPILTRAERRRLQNAAVAGNI